MRATTRLTFMTMAPLLLLAACSDGQEIEPGDDSASTRADAAALAAADDGQWLTLTGTVVSAAADAFVLDYGAGNVTVEMDDWDWYQEGRVLKAGDEVTVSGLADQDLLLNKRIEARSVYVRNLNSFFFASSDDEESRRASAAMTANATNNSDFTGRVSAIEGRELTVGTGPAAIRVDTSALADNPLDAEGAHRVRVGDRIFVWGDLDLDAAEGAEIKARGLVSLVPNASVGANGSASADAPMANGAQPANVAQPVDPMPPANDAAPVANNVVEPTAN